MSDIYPIHGLVLHGSLSGRRNREPCEAGFVNAGGALLTQAPYAATKPKAFFAGFFAFRPLTRQSASAMGLHGPHSGNTGNPLQEPPQGIEGHRNGCRCLTAPREYRKGKRIYRAPARGHIRSGGHFGFQTPTERQVLRDGSWYTGNRPDPWACFFASIRRQRASPAIVVTRQGALVKASWLGQSPEHPGRQGSWLRVGSS